MATKKKIVEKGSYEKGKVETYPSKKAMVKHEKKETKPFEKGESKKPSPMKSRTSFQGVKPKTDATIKPSKPATISVSPKDKFVTPSPIVQKKSPCKMCGNPVCKCTKMKK
jgi:hypothetical protein